MKALSTLYREYKEKKHTYAMVFEEYLELLEHSRFRDRARGLFVQMIRLLKKGEGYLIDVYGQSYTHDKLASQLDRNPAHVKADLDQMIKFDILATDDDGNIFCPLMVAVIEGLAKDKGKQTQSRRIQKQLNSSAFCNDDIVTTPRGEDSEKQYVVNKSKVEKSFFSPGTKPGTKKNSSTTVTNSDKTEEKVSGSLTQPEPFPGLSVENLETVRSEHPDKDFSIVYQKFVDYHTGKGTKSVTLVQLRGWFKREKGGSKSEQSSGTKPSGKKPYTANSPKLKYKSEKMDKADWDDEDVPEYCDVPYIDNFEAWNLTCEASSMDPMTESDAHNYLCGVVGFEWDTQHALKMYRSDVSVCPKDQAIFRKMPDGLIAGIHYLTEDERRQRDEEQERLAKARAEREAQKAMEEAERLKREEEARLALQAKLDAMNTNEFWFENMVRYSNPRQTLEYMKAKENLPDVANWIQDKVTLEMHNGDKLKPRDNDHAWSIAHKAIELGLIVCTGEAYVGSKS